MKRATLILLAAIGMLLGTSKYASASDFSGNCSDFVTWSNTDGNGNATVSDSSCSISTDASATGFITITADSVDAQDLSAGGTLTITSSSGSISAGALTTSGGYVWLTANSGTITLSDDIQTNGGTVVLWASQDISAFDIDAGGFGDHSDVRIFANQDNSGSDTFNIGSGGDANGVGSIFDSNDVGGNIIYIANAGSGGITYSSAELTVDASAAKSGQIIFDASHGTGSVVLNGGTISIDNDDGFLGGNVSIMTSTGTGAQVVVADDMTISTNSSSNSSTLSGAGVGIATDQLIMNANLTISVNGNGPIGGGIGGVNQVGWLNITVPTDPTMPIPGFSYSVTDNPLSITGTGTLEFDAAGNNNYIVVGGNSMVLTAPTVINNTGSNTHTFLWSHDSSTNQAMTIGNVQAYAETESSSDTPGNVTLAADEITSVTGLVWLEASSNGGANGGTVEVDLNEGTLPLNYYGNALALWSLANDSGNGGTVNVNAGTADVVVQDPFGAPNVSVTGTGNGGTINVTGNSLTTSGAFAAIFFAQGNGSGGNGGNININVSGDLGADASNGGIFTIANANVAGDGGNVTLNAGGTLNIDGGIAIQVAGVTDGTTSGNGGTLTATGNTINTEGDQIDASGALNGNGGTISLTADDIESFGSQLITANASGSGNGGTINLTSETDLNIDDDSFKLNANAADSGNGGNISLTAPDISMDGSDSSFLTVTAGTNGNGGNISLTGDPDEGTIGILNNLDASGGSTAGDGGTITMSASDITSDGALTISANAPGSGDGGEITINSGSDLSVDDDDFVFQANATGTGDGGTINITATNVTADGGSITATASESGNGGTIAVTGDPDSGTVEIDNTLDASAGSTAGDGGSISLSAATLTLTDSTLSADSPTGDGGNIHLTYASGDMLNVGSLSAVTTNDSGGGSITISNTQDADLSVEAAGNIQTTTSDTLSGSLTLTVSDVAEDAVTLTIDDTGGFDSILSTDAASVDVDAAPIVTLGLGDIVVESGEFNITADGTCTTSCLAAVPARSNSSPRTLRPRTPTLSTIDLTNEIVAKSQGGNISGQIFILEPGALIDLTLTNSQTVTITTEEIGWAGNSYLVGNNTNVSLIAGNYSDGLTLVLPGGSAAGIKGANNIVIGNDPALTPPQANQPLSIRSDADSNTTLILQSSTTPTLNTGNTSVSGGAISIFDTTIGSTDFPLTGLSIDSQGGNVSFTDDLALCTTVNDGNVDIVSHAGTITTNCLINGGIVTMTAASGSVTVDGAVLALSGDVNITSGSAMEIGGAITSYQDTIVSAGSSLNLNSSISAGNTSIAGPNGSIEVTAGSTITFDGGDMFSTNEGDMTFQAGSGSGNRITIPDSVSFDSQGNIDFSVGRTAQQMCADSGGSTDSCRPSGVSQSQIHISNGGHLYWNDASTITLGGSLSSFTANGERLNFDANGNAVSIGNSVTFNAHQ